ncbi:MAG: amino acid adenylation protein, partial [Francisellaceae bacterium]|nr:amino acid adenylation protein [Francisellaceae bacterium]
MTNVISEEGFNDSPEGSKLLTLEEQYKVLKEWNNTTRSYPENKTIHHLFEQQVVRTPNAPAIVFKEQSLSFNELNQQSNQLAHYLRKQGVGPDVLVIISYPQSFEVFIGILAILKAGGSYVPIDPSYPKERISYILEDTKSKIILTHTDLLDSFPQTNAQIITLNKIQLENYSKNNLSDFAQSRNLAYVIYTSGSTGKPKGVMIEHKSINRLIFNQNYILLSTQSVIAQTSNIAFDAATFEIWGSFLLGGKLILIDKNEVLSSTSLGMYIKKHGINVMWLTSSLFNSLFDQNPDIFKGIQYLLIGGEALSYKHVRKCLSGKYVTHLINGYGPTESTTFAVCNILNESDNFEKNVPIGRPISNTQVYILNSFLKPISIETNGELYIGGEGLARGYLNNPKLSQERFIDNPFVSDADKILGKNLKLYKTGDICRWLADGNIEYIGRIDDQVKIRGFRIELGEIETVLLN